MTKPRKIDVRDALLLGAMVLSWTAGPALCIACPIIGVALLLRR